MGFSEYRFSFLFSSVLLMLLLLFTSSVNSFVHRRGGGSRRIITTTSSFFTKSRELRSQLYASTSRDSNLKKLDEFRSLLSDCIKLAADTGVKVGIKRTIQLISASTKLTSDFINKPEMFLTKDNTPSLPKILRKLFEELGATYIKLGQFVASSPTLFPAEYVLEFQSCLDRSPTVPFASVKQILESELGTRNLKQYFSSIDPVPVASASIAQVCMFCNLVYFLSTHLFLFSCLLLMGAI